jgi:hypothetical protein
MENWRSKRSAADCWRWMRSLVRALRRKLSDIRWLFGGRKMQQDGLVTVTWCSCANPRRSSVFLALVVTSCVVRRLEISWGQHRCALDEVVPTCFNIRSLIQPSFWKRKPQWTKAWKRPPNKLFCQLLFTANFPLTGRLLAPPRILHPTHWTYGGTSPTSGVKAHI